jgi:hypothetical protein
MTDLPPLMLSYDDLRILPTHGTLLLIRNLKQRGYVWRRKKMMDHYAYAQQCLANLGKYGVETAPTDTIPRPEDYRTAEMLKEKREKEAKKAPSLPATFKCSICGTIGCRADRCPKA